MEPNNCKRPLPGIVACLVPVAALALAVFLPAVISGCAEKAEPSLELAVFDSKTGQPVGGATVDIYQNGALVKTVSTDSSGTALAVGLMQGQAYDLVASANDYSREFRQGFAFDSGQHRATFVLDYAKAGPVPSNRYFDDSLVSDILTGLGEYAGTDVTVSLHKVLLNEDGSASWALFDLSYHGGSVRSGHAVVGSELGELLSDENNARPFAEKIIVKSLGFDDARRLGYADLEIK